MDVHKEALQFRLKVLKEVKQKIRQGTADNFEIYAIKSWRKMFKQNAY